MANEVQKINSDRPCNIGAVAYPPVLAPTKANLDNYNVVTTTVDDQAGATYLGGVPIYQSQPAEYT